MAAVEPIAAMPKTAAPTVLFFTKFPLQTWAHCRNGVPLFAAFMDSSGRSSQPKISILQ